MQANQPQHTGSNGDTIPDTKATVLERRLQSIVKLQTWEEQCIFCLDYGRADQLLRSVSHFKMTPQNLWRT